MKGQVSRISQDRSKLYSAVFQTQGAMVTDADLGEASFIARARTDELGADAVGSGVPADGGIIALGADHRATLREGLVYADGVRGTVKLRPGTSLTAGQPLDLYGKQLDLPAPPALPAGDLVFYADVWEQARFPLTEPGLTDPGFHGAETSFRSRTVAQIKTAPAASRGDLGAPTHAFPRKGDAVLTAELATGATAADPCDPCATEVASEVRLGNALFRLEVIKATGAADAPGQVTLAWSLENAAESFACNPRPPAAFTGRAGSVFEFFSETTELHKGAFADPASRRHSHLENSYPGTTPARDDGTAGSWPYVRRWDGYAVIAAAGPTVTSAVGGTATIEAGRLKVALDSLVFRLETAGKRMMVGDYWLVELREFADPAAKVRVVSPTPVGIEHHYTALFTTSGGTVVPLSDADQRAASFPSLDNLPADHIGYENHCQKLYGPEPHINVQQALDALCGIEARDISFDNNCPTVFDSATTVQEALDALCRTDFSPRMGYRLLFDWGVVCGIRVKKRNQRRDDGWVDISAGAFLDRTGRLVSGVRKMSVNILTGEGISPNPDPEKEGLKPEGVANFLPTSCLAVLAHPDQTVTVHIVDQDDCWWPEDRTYRERVAACKDELSSLKGALTGALGKDRGQATDKFVLAVEADEPLAARYHLAREEEGEVDDLIGELKAALEPRLSKERGEALDTAFAKAEADNDPRTAAGAAADNKRGRRAIEKFKAVARLWDLETSDCACDHYFPDCPSTDDKRPPYVPIACVQLLGGEVNEVCEFCCRKQALTPRTFRYWKGDEFWADQISSQGKCCKPLSKDGGGGSIIGPPDFKPPKGPVLGWPPYVDDSGWIPPKYNPDPDPLGPVKWTSTPDVMGLDREAGLEVLEGHGLKVAKIVDLGEGDPLELLAGEGQVSAIERLTVGSAINPGDQVAMLVENGVTRGYTVLARGDGAYLFQTTAGQAQSGFAEQLHLLKRDVQALRAEKTLSSGGEAEPRFLHSDLRAEVDELDAEHTALEKAVTQLKRELKDVKAEREAMTRDLAAARVEMKALGDEQRKMLDSLREAHPVTVAMPEHPDLIESLHKAGVATLGEFQRMASGLLNRVFDTAKVSEADRRKIITDVKARLGREDLGREDEKD